VSDVTEQMDTSPSLEAEMIESKTEDKEKPFQVADYFLGVKFRYCMRSAIIMARKNG